VNTIEQLEAILTEAINEAHDHVILVPDGQDSEVQYRNGRLKGLLDARDLLRRLASTPHKQEHKSASMYQPTVLDRPSRKTAG
jgi:hypothetical protein